MRGKQKIFPAVTFLLLAISLAWVFKPSSRQQNPPRAGTGPMRIVTTTSLLECAIREIGGKHVKVSVLVAPGNCPGRYDICPNDLRELSTSRMLFTHEHEGFVPKIMDSLGSSKPKQIAIHAGGNWMIPSVYIRALDQVTDALCSLDPTHSGDYRKSFVELKAGYEKLDVDLRHQLKSAGVSRVSVLCSDQQVEIARWMGLAVVDTYPRAEEFTPVLLHYMTDLGRKKNVRLCIDNLQSSPAAGKELAKDIGAAHVTLSSFPCGYAETGTWSKCVQDNVSRVIEGIEER